MHDVQERKAQIVMLVRAFEEVDPDGIVLAHRERAKATRRALLVTGLSGDRGLTHGAWRRYGGEAVARRARSLFDMLRRAHPAMPRIFRVAQLGSSAGPLVVGAALALGLALNALDPRGEIHIVYVPVLAVLGWNLALFATLPALVLARGPTGRGPTSRIAGWLFRRAVRRRLQAARFTDDRGSPEAEVVHRALMRFAASWRRLASPLLAARARRLEHLAAGAVMAGVTCGLWLRATVLGQHVAWDARWLDPPDMQTLVGAILGPAATVLGTHVPDVSTLFGASGGEPAPWVALYATTGLLFVLVPRAVLALVEGLRIRRLCARLPLDLEDAYFVRMFSAWRGATRQVEVVPIGGAPHPVPLGALKTLLFDYFGAHAEVRTRDPVPDPADALGRIAGLVHTAREVGRLDLCLVLLFRADEPPGAAVEALLRELTARLDPQRDQLLLVLDGAPGGNPSPVGHPSDVEWTELLERIGRSALRIDLGASAGTTRITLQDRPVDDLLDAVRAALVPR